MKIARCNKCAAPVIWATMKRSGKPNPLNAIPVAEVRLGEGQYAFNPATVGDSMVTKNNIDDVCRWVREGRVSVHTSHFGSCLARGRFRESDDDKVES